MRPRTGPNSLSDRPTIPTRFLKAWLNPLLNAVDVHLIDRELGLVLRTDASSCAIRAVLKHVLEDSRYRPAAY